MDQMEVRLAPGTVARAVLITMGLVALALLLWAGRNVLFVLFFGVLVGVFISVFADRLEEWGVPRVAAVLLVMLGLLAILAAFAILVWPTVRDQLSTVGQELPRAIDRAADWLQSQYGSITGTGTAPAAELEEDLRQRLGGQIGTVVSGAMPIINTAFGAVAGALVVLAVGIYTAANPGLYRRGLERLVPPARRDRMSLAIDRTGTSLRRWMVGTLINMVLVGVGTGVALWLLGVPAAIALAVLAGLLEFIPIVGPILAAIPAIALALLVSPMTAVWVTLLYVVIQQIEGNVLTPVVMRGAVRLPPALTVLFQTLMAVVFGFPGLLLAVPILAVVMVAARTLYIEPMEASSPGPSAT